MDTESLSEEYTEIEQEVRGEAKPVDKAGGAEFVSKAKPIGKAEPIGEAEPVGKAKPVGEARPVGGGKPGGGAESVGGAKPQGKEAERERNGLNTVAAETVDAPNYYEHLQVARDIIKAECWKEVEIVRRRDRAKIELTVV